MMEIMRAMIAMEKAITIAFLNLSSDPIPE